MFTVTTTLLPVIEQFRLQTQLLLNVSGDISEEHAKAHLAGSPNHIVWIIGHVVSMRYLLGSVLGMTDKEPYPELFEGGKGIQEISYPSIAQLTTTWEEQSAKLIARLESLTEDDLQVEPPFRTPVKDKTLRGFIAFLAHHEAYHLGQLGLARRYFGYQPMRYP
jgi:uncharacterized damage-inducible protein DinB